MTFSELDLHPAVADALAARGYDTATPVQAAVLNTEHAARDLLVSSQTGSGKTVAFGAALANTLLGPGAPPREQRTAPIALVVVPTRELAVQVRQELGWLLEKTGLRLASFTGGTAVTGDLRVLQRGIDVVIGTPGRLVDLLRRQRLDLTHIRVVVLDEADEMLDLGFREDLQTLLQAAAPERRTLLLSATLPPEIQALAKRFQRDAVRIDPRKDAGADVRASHGDITFVAHLIAGADRLAVVVNVLRAAGNSRAIVFCTTREGVSRLHAALLARGFAATAISGDRAQAERDRALEQVRRGDVQILVATNVAARGLHLPDVDLIVHADLPLNAESLTHRSGRTGRAGRKGTAVVIASLSERRKAERLLSSAHVKVLWTAPPSAEAITAAARERLIEELLGAAPGNEESTEARSKNAGSKDAESKDAGSKKQERTGNRKKDSADDATALSMVDRLEATLPARELARRLLVRELAHLPVGERVHPVAVPGPGTSRRDNFDESRDSDRRSGEGPRSRSRSDFSREGVLFRVNIGAKENADPRWLLPLICRRGGVTRNEVGSIRVGQAETLFEIAGDAAADFALTASEQDPRAPHVRIERARPASAGQEAPREPSAPRPHVSASSRNEQSARSTPHATRPAPHAPRPVSHAPRPVSHAPRPAPHAPRPAPHAPRPASQAPRPASQAQRPTPQAQRPAPQAQRPTPQAPDPVREEPSVVAALPAEHVAQPRTAPHESRPADKRAAAAPEAREQPEHRASRPKPAAPVVEMKRAPRPAAGQRGTFRAEPPPHEGKRHFSVGGAPDRGRPHRNDAPRVGPHADRGGSRAPRGGSHADRPRMDGTNPLKRSFGSHAAASAPPPSPPPFWKAGARQRPTGPARRPEPGEKKNRPPLR